MYTYNMAKFMGGFSFTTSVRMGLAGFYTGFFLGGGGGGIQLMVIR